MATLALICGWIVAVFLGLLGLVIIVLIVTGRIDLKDLLHDESGKASLARFQFLIFTFVIAVGLLVVTLSKEPPQFPAEIPAGILLLLGLSGASFLGAKAIDAFARANSREPRLDRYEAQRRAVEEAERRAHAGGAPESSSSWRLPGEAVGGNRGASHHSSGEPS